MIEEVLCRVQPWLTWSSFHCKSIEFITKSEFCVYSLWSARRKPNGETSDGQSRQGIRECGNGIHHSIFSESGAVLNSHTDTFKWSKGKIEPRLILDIRLWKWSSENCRATFFLKPRFDDPPINYRILHPGKAWTNSCCLKPAYLRRNNLQNHARLSMICCNIIWELPPMMSITCFGKKSCIPFRLIHSLIRSLDIRTQMPMTCCNLPHDFRFLWSLIGQLVFSTTRRERNGKNPFC